MWNWDWDWDWLAFLALSLLAGIAVVFVCRQDMEPPKSIVTCYAGEKVIYQGPGRVFNLGFGSGCTVYLPNHRFECSACAVKG